MHYIKIILLKGTKMSQLVHISLIMTKLLASLFLKYVGGYSHKTLATWYEELTHWKRPWCWDRLKAGGEGDNRRWDGWMPSPTRWTWVWASSRSWWWTERPGVLQSMESQRVGHNWVTELNWTLTISWCNWNERSGILIKSALPMMYI